MQGYPQQQYVPQEYGTNYASYYASPASTGAPGNAPTPEAVMSATYQSPNVPYQTNNANQWNQQYQQQGASNPYMATAATGDGVATGSQVYGGAMPQSDLAYTPQNVPPPPAANATDESGLRWTWSAYPNEYREARQEAPSAAALTMPEMIIPLACMYTPLFPLDTNRLVVGDPVSRGQKCPNCGAFWSRHCFREEGKFWMCLSCLRRNPMPPGCSPQHPALHYDTVEYILPPEKSPAEGRRSPSFPTFIFIIDTCISVEELSALQKNIVRSLDWLPSQSLVGLVTFGARVSVWDLGNNHFSRCYSIRGERSCSTSELTAMLQLSEACPAYGRFLVPLGECEFTLTTLINELQCDGTVTPINKRPLRATGTAVGVAVKLLESLYEIQGGKSGMTGGAGGGTGVPAVKVGKLLLFTGGPCTRGPGTVVAIEKEKMMRFHRDIIEGETPYYEDAFKFYGDIQKRLLSVQASLSVFAQSFDQIGILEMRRAVDQTGGAFICGDSFDHPMFTTSLQRYFELCDFRLGVVEDGSASGSDAGRGPSSFVARSGFGVKLEVHTSADTLVCGVLGPCVADEKAAEAKVHRTASPIQIGVGGTTRWRVSAMDQTVTLTFVFDTATLNKKDVSTPQQRRFIQFVTQFYTSHGESRLRVTSVLLPIASQPAGSQSAVDPQYFVQHDTFDQTCAATVLARMTISLLEKHPSKWSDAKRWLDTVLVQFVRRYGTFTPGAPETVRLRPCCSLFPSFVFNLRRSEYFMVLNISPDETTFKRHWLMRESVDNCVLMIQPTLHSYDIDCPSATAVPLDSCSLRPDNILLMDAFFNIHIMWGTTVFAWIQAKYHENPEFAHFAQLLDLVENDAGALLDSRQPYPRFSRTDANGSEARHIKTRMNPATTHHSSSGGAVAGSSDQSGIIYTDDASIMKFMESLKQAVVSQNLTDRNSQGGSRGGM